MQEINHDYLSSKIQCTLQLVWKASTKVGFGVATDGNQKYVVARYTPRGNIGGSAEYEANVLPADPREWVDLCSDGYTWY